LHKAPAVKKERIMKEVGSGCNIGRLS